MGLARPFHKLNRIFRGRWQAGARLAVAAVVGGLGIVSGARGQEAPPEGVKLPTAVFESNAATSEIPFAGNPYFVDDFRHQIYFRGFLNDKPATFFLDTLAQTDVVSVDAAKRLGFTGEVTAGSPTVSTMSIPRLRIGTVELRDDTAEITPYGGDTRDGILGYNTLSQVVMQIDWRAKRLRFIDPARFVPPAQAQVLPLQLSSARTPIIEAEINGVKANFVLDTSLDAALFMETKFAVKNAVWDKWATNSLRKEPGRDERELTTLVMKIGDYSIVPLVAGLPMPPQYLGPQRPTPHDGRIGAELLKHFVVTLDYPHGKLYLVKADPPAAPAALADIKKFDYPAAPEKSLPPKAASACRSVQAFQKQFSDYSARDANAAAYDRVCTPDFTVVFRPFGKVLQTVTREQFLQAIRMYSYYTPELMQNAVQLSLRHAEPRTIVMDDRRFSGVRYWRAPQFESKGDKILLTVSPLIPEFRFGVHTETEQRMTFQETFVRTKVGLRLQRLEMFGLAEKFKGTVTPEAVLKTNPIYLRSFYPHF